MIQLIRMQLQKEGGGDANLPSQEKAVTEATCLAARTLRATLAIIHFFCPRWKIASLLSSNRSPKAPNQDWMKVQDIAVAYTVARGHQVCPFFRNVSFYVGMFF